MADAPVAQRSAGPDAVSGTALCVPMSLATRNRAEATHCTVRWLDDPVPGDPSLPLAGFTVAHKDIFDLDGWRPGCGHDAGAPAPGRTAAPVVSRLQRAGGLQVASLAMAEYACGATARNERMPSCLHPWHAVAALGGSSSGSAAAVSLSIARGSLCSDTMGSVRIPAATCGVLGLKPTFGALPTQGMAPLAPSLDTVGLVARTPEDLQLLWDAARCASPSIAPSEPPSLSPPTTSSSPPLAISAVSPPPHDAGAGLRVAAWLPPKSNPLVESALRHVLSLAASRTVLDTLEGFDEASRFAELMLHGEAAITLARHLEEPSLSATVRAVALPGAALPPAWLKIAANARPALLKRFVARHFGACDILLLPALAGPVPDRASVDPDHAAFDPRALVALYRFMGFANYLGLPAIVFPAVADERGLPVCVQAVARPHREDLLLRLARHCRRLDERVADASYFHGADSNNAQDQGQ